MTPNNDPSANRDPANRDSGSADQSPHPSTEAYQPGSWDRDEELEPIKFYKRDAPYFSLTNFSRHPIEVAGVTYPTSEHYFQAAKFFISDPEWARAIALAVGPREAAEMGRDREHLIDPHWEDIKNNVMRVAIAIKILTHPDVKADLMKTGNAYLIEDSPRDSYWGCGADGQGRNMLGKLLMEARSLISAEVRESRVHRRCTSFNFILQGGLEKNSSISTSRPKTRSRITCF